VKLLVISGAIPPMQAGESDHTIRLCRHLVDSGHDVHLLTTRAGIVPDDLAVTAHQLAGDWSWRDVPRLVRLLRTCRPDGVLLLYTSWIYNDHPMVTFVPTLVRWVLPKARFVTQFEIADGSRPYRMSLLDRAIWKGLMAIGGRGVHYALGTLLRDSHRVVVLCEHHRRTLEGHHPGVSERVLLLPPPPLMKVVSDTTGAMRRDHRQTHGLSPDEFLFVHYGYVYPNKGIETLLKAFATVAGRQPAARLVIAGGALTDGRATPYLQQLQEMARNSGIADRVTWTGEIRSDADDGSLWLHAADACVFPFDAGVSLHRSSIAAAAIHGRPIITTQGPIFESPPFVDRDNVLLCPPSDPASLAVAMERLMGDAGLCTTLATGSHALGRACFSWSTTVDRTLAALQA
jgi:glycosyltransferase involved in cell wall biosynthesis